MKLNPDCIRDILLEIEHLNLMESISFYETDELPDSLKNYSYDEVFYHLKQCELNDFLSKINWFVGGCMAFHLAPAGHQFLSDIRDDNNWNKTKEIAKSIGSNSLHSLLQIASGVIASLIQAQLGPQ